MKKRNPSIDEINSFIQDKMRELGMESVTPVEATKWLVEAGLREKI